MTPAKLLALEDTRLDELELIAHPVDRLAWLYANAQRDPGDGENRPAAPELPFAMFKSYNRRKDGSLAAKEADWDYTLQGAKADREAFMAWSQVRSGAKFVPKGE